MTGSGRTLVAVLAIPLALAGCGPSQSATPGPAASPTPAPTATAAPTRTPAPDDVAELRANPAADLAPGRYTRNGFVPRITFAVDGPWRAVQVLPGFFDVQQDVGSPDVIAVQFARPDGIYTGEAGTLLAPESAAAAVAALQANPNLTTVEASESLMDGQQGLQITVENPASAAGDVAVLHVPPGPLGISPSRRLWIAFFDRPEGLLAIMVGGSVAEWEPALLAAEPVLESVTIGR
jgi:hypothetical protein